MKLTENEYPQGRRAALGSARSLAVAIVSKTQVEKSTPDFALNKQFEKRGGE